MITSYLPDRCGISDYSEQLVGSLRKAGADVLVVSREGGRIASDNVHRVIAVKAAERSLSQIWTEVAAIGRASEDAGKSMEIIGEFNPDAVHVQYEPGLYNLFYIPMLLDRLKRNKVKTIVTLHAIDYFPLTVFHKIFLYGKPDRIIVHTKSHAELMKRSLGAKAAKKVEVIPMGLVPQTPGKDGKYLLFFGFLNPHKGVEDLIEAFGNVRCKEKLFIIGSINPAFKPDAGYNENIKRLIRRLGLGGRVNFVYKFAPRNKLLSYIKNSMFAVFPYRSSYSGAQSQAILDAVAFAKPLIVTKPAKGNLIDNENAIVVEPGNVEPLSGALERLIRSKGLRQKLSRNNRALADELNWERVAYATLLLYENI